MKIKDLKKHDIFKHKGQKYRIVGLNNFKSSNNVLCKNLETNKLEWFDLATDIKEGVEENGN